MPKRAVDDWEHQRHRRLQERQREEEEFIERWDWKRVFREWSRRIESFNVVLDPLFLTVNIHDPKNPTERESELSWWPTNEVHEVRASCQRHFNRWPGTRGSPHPDGLPLTKGAIETVRYLWEQRADPEMVAAVLISGSLFSRLHSRRARYPDDWPKAHCVHRLDQWAREKWLGPNPGNPWHPLSTDVLPAMSEDYVYKIDSMSALVRYLAEEHAATLHSYRAVEVRFVAAPDPFVARILDEEREAQLKRAAEWAEHRRLLEESEAKQLAELRREHPRWGEFPRVTKEELTRLVWSRPTTQIAKEFGVSDVAIGKRCKVQFIPKPPPGFWRRVEAGKVPNPMGIAPV
jgi:hypothetical protein